MFYGIVKLGRRGDLDRYSLFLLQVAGIQAVGIVFLGLSIWARRDGPTESSGVFLIVAVLSVGLAAVIRIFDWIRRMRRPMDPTLIDAAFDAEKILEGLTPRDEGPNGGTRRVEDVLRRLRSSLAPYRGGISRRRR
jgi:hypothetical protein